MKPRDVNLYKRIAHFILWFFDCWPLFKSHKASTNRRLEKKLTKRLISLLHIITIYTTWLFNSFSTNQMTFRKKFGKMFFILPYKYLFFLVDSTLVSFNKRVKLSLHNIICQKFYAYINRTPKNKLKKYFFIYCLI